jgi:hypothetical protein
MKRTTFPADVAALIEARSECACEVWAPGCNRRMEHKHHRRLKGSGGSQAPETQRASNGLAVCQPCHTYIHGHPLWAFDEGFLVSQYRLPVEMPVRWRGGGKRLLDDGGGLGEH